jgi:hypothetical protein
LQNALAKLIFSRKRMVEMIVGLMGFGGIFPALV